mgnify:CR=1 FL=1
MKQLPLLRTGIFFSLTVIFVLILAVTACNNLGEDSHGDSDVTASKTASFSYTAAEVPSVGGGAQENANGGFRNIFELSEDTLSVIVSGDIAGHELFLVKTNPTDTVIDSSRARYVVSVNDESTAAGESDARMVKNHKRIFDEDITTHFDPPQEFDPNEAVPEAARAASFSVQTVTPTEFACGDTREIFVDANEAISTFEKQTATLLAIGKKCYVWVVDVPSNRAAEIYAAEVAETFDKLYSSVTTVYGNESDTLYVFNGSNFTLADMACYSMTGTRVNIVLSRFVSVGTVGYFYCKDYYTGYTAKASDARASSNSGKYLYINTRYMGTERSRSMVYSTLAHEFQHLIMFGQKNIRCGVSAANWFNEMMSMICEDLLQDELGIANAQSPKNRLGRFAASYYLSGAAEFISVDGSYLPSYAALYGFGAYLIRTYGGAAFVNRIMQSDYCNEQAIAKAVSAVTGREMTFSEIVQLYALSFVSNGMLSMNQPPEGSPFFEEFRDEATDYRYPLDPINMTDYLQKGSAGDYGMKLFLPEERVALRPNGFSLHSLGTATDDVMTIMFSETGAAGLKLFLIVAD